MCITAQNVGRLGAHRYFIDDELDFVWNIFVMKSGNGVME